MSFYERWILPRLIDWTMRAKDLVPYRERVVALACGQVLEVGIGSGLNLRLYGEKVEHVIGLDPSPELLNRAAGMANKAKSRTDLVQARAEALPIPDGSVDTVLMTWTLCSLSDAGMGLAEMRRVLKSKGVLLFVEHGLAPDANVARWQHRLDPLWRRFSCHLDLPVPQLISEAGFR